MAGGVLADFEGHHPETHGGQTQTPMAQPLAGKLLTQSHSTPFEPPGPFDERSASLQGAIHT